MEQPIVAAPAPAGDNPAAMELALGLPTDPFTLTAEHLDRAFEALADILRSPQARAAGKRPHDALRDAMKQLDRYHSVLGRMGDATAAIRESLS